ncbi:phytoene desaturase family protein [Chryseosolibacter indicus]|uniref:NAD(P)/FAD-dependent oxidoreductase n=1 Tax=Chryseosolibacter indicus TaxID=2782351 RepID=A0ABS5VQX2_9BACT|nr:NAD(P)/FAD-dependent oxidoreductase [Chryseosolibacter indicus]MBT1703843.1 NAD(P)/FAD-dependent oxidoreductase [Chryseosolibacter indicus]
MATLGKRDFDAVVVGSGPNGLAAAITLQQAGLSVLIVEAKDTIGGGLRTAEVTLPGFKHDICSAIHPLAIGSPFFSTLPLKKHGLEYIFPTFAAAHPFDDGSAAILDSSIENTAHLLRNDKKAYLHIIKPVVNSWNAIIKDILGPLSYPKHPFALAKFGLKALQPADFLAQLFSTKAGRGLWAGMAAHSILPLSKVATSAIALVLMSAGHIKGWPIPKGGSQSIANALASYFTSIGGQIQTNFYVKSLDQLPSSHAVLFDITPKQLLQIAGHKFSSLYKFQLEKYKYGMGVFKVDWALDDVIPFTAAEARHAGTVHIGNTYEEIRGSEKEIWRGGHPEKPFILLAQQSLFDPTRAPEGKHTAWAYCHVPNGSTVDMTEVIEKQIERFAPGFRSRILSRSVMNTSQMESYNANYIGGDINGGAITIGQLFTRPALRLSPYRTSAKGLYICSSSTPPGGGVHGMCGYNAAKRALKDIFHKNATPI